MELYNKTKESVKETNKQVISQGLSLVSSAFVFVAALAWNEAIKELISTYLKDDSGILSRFIYATLVTVIAVVVTSRLNKIAEKYKNDPNSQQK